MSKFISYYDYHIVSIWQFDCRNNIFREWLNKVDIFIKSGEFEFNIFLQTETALPSSPGSVVYL